MIGLPSTSAPTDTPAASTVAPLTRDPAFVRCVQAELPLLAAEMVEGVARSIPQIERVINGRREPAVRNAANERIRLLFEQLVAPRLPRQERVALCRELGRDAFHQDISLDSLQNAFRVSTQIAWRRFTHIGHEVGASAEQICLLTDLLFEVTNKVCAHSLSAYTELSADSADSQQSRRKHLLEALLAEPATDMDALVELARAAQWRLPRTVACVALDESWHTGHRLPPALESDVLVDLTRPDPCLLVPDPDGPGRLRMLRRGLRDTRFTIGTTVPLRQARTSLRLARRSLALVQRGLLQEGAAGVHCADHLPALLLLGDEDVARQLVRRHLPAFTALKPEQRERLAETLLTWLTSGGSYPEVAVRLSVHPQTVRYRMRQIEGLFGDRLHDPEWRFEMLLALHADRLAGGTGDGRPDPAVR
ncbi:PucR family transcriptional regulator [Actinomadura craniellae]|uniref:PucR family transcriptional regulator n=1 Tax=Actinomadura craniellae TaxID=2231787 RepID=A0A365H156_9ACTN|nr:PucR family transcriptional regulator [Actinomadura craniellae]RAY12824.1 PucR family transcriptional regulator [Actinomadura craniellae]